MTYFKPPKGLRVLILPDRLILHDISFAFRAEPSDRNALIDAVNSVHRQLTSQDDVPQKLIDFDFPTPPSHTSGPRSLDRTHRHRYFVLPFATDNAPHELPPPFEAATPEHAGITPSTVLDSVPVDAAAAFLGLLPLHSGTYAVLATQVRRGGTHPSGTIFSITKVRLVRLATSWQSKEDKELASAVAKLLEGGSVYFSLNTDLTARSQSAESRRRRDAFCWNYSLMQRVPTDCHHWLIHTAYGFVATHIMRFQSDALQSGTGEFLLTVISRRSRLRAGTRYITRGVDGNGDVANYVETEQIAWRENQPRAFTSFVVTRGSIPTFWRQNNGIAKPSPELDGSLGDSRRAFAKHFDSMKDSYGYVNAVSLVDMHGSEGVLATAFERYFELYLKPFNRERPPKLLSFDFHKHCAGKEYERGLNYLMEKIGNDIRKHGLFAAEATEGGHPMLQKGVFRVNCVDCLDRTNVVQSKISRVALDMQIKVLFLPVMKNCTKSDMPRLYGESEDRFKHIWGDNADAISKQYSGTGALKTDFTRTGKRSTSGVIGDGVKSVMRMYYKNFVDEGRQEVIDALCGTVTIRHSSSPLSSVPGSTLSSLPSESEGAAPVPRISKSLWYSFEALRINAGGDKQPVFVELHDEKMYVTTPEGIAWEYPRQGLLSWSKYEESKSSDRKFPVRLRVVYKPSYENPATASPLDLQFRAGTTARENFLRALVSWSTSATAAVMRRKPIRIRTLAGLNAGEHTMADWGLEPSPEAESVDEIVVLSLPEGNALTRSWGLAAVPVDVDFSDYTLAGACAVNDRGPAIAILASKSIAPTIMTVSEATTTRSGQFSSNGAAGCVLQVCGTSLCFVSVNLNGPADMFNALSSLKLGRPSFDISNQFHHFFVLGLTGDMHWYRSEAPGYGPEARKWVELSDGTSCYTLGNGLSVMRNSFASLTYKDRLSAKSFWRAENRSAHNGESMHSVLVSDGVIEGRLGPQLPKKVSQSTVMLSKLRAEDVKIPRGIDQSSQMTCFLALFCDFATVDGVVSRQTPRPTSFPEWPEPVKVTLMPSDEEEIYSSFLIGQILVPTPLGDPIAAGHFVIPISAARAGGGIFSVPCRLAGVQTGTLSGQVSLETGVSVSKELDSTVAVSHSIDPRDDVSRLRSSLPPLPESGGSEFQASGTFQKRAQSVILPKSGGTLPSNRQKTSLEDMNGKLDAARRKGSKQIKSVVGKLSSLLNQQQSSGSTTSHSAPKRNSPDFSWKQDSSQREIQEAFGSGSSVDNGNFAASRDYGNIGQDKITSSAGAPLNDPSQGKRSNEFASFASSDVAGSRLKQGSGIEGEDALLKGLRREDQFTADRLGLREAPAHFDSDGVDSLMGGLAEQKMILSESASRHRNDTTDEDDWGDFVGA